MKDLTALLLGGDLRSLGRTREVLQSVSNQETFDVLFNMIFHHERALAMRAADSVEKITREEPHYLKSHKAQLVSLLRSTINKEIKWHVAQLIPRLDLSQYELKDVWGILSHQTLNPNESKIVRVNSLQALYELSRQFVELKSMFEHTLQTIGHDPYPSIQARIRKLKNYLPKIKESRKAK